MGYTVGTLCGPNIALLLTQLDREKVENKLLQNDSSCTSRCSSLSQSALEKKQNREYVSSILIIIGFPAAPVLPTSNGLWTLLCAFHLETGYTIHIHGVGKSGTECQSTRGSGFNMSCLPSEPKAYFHLQSIQGVPVS